ncbi:MAG: outer membrane lipoprotein-sorting protein [Gammaproteobacteria bacterium]|nr:outer membrane lipoprotein-sorting protein [Gammaproteobacteria bacterium]
MHFLPRLRRQRRARILRYHLYTAVVRAVLPCTHEKITIFSGAPVRSLVRPSAQLSFILGISIFLMVVCAAGVACANENWDGAQIIDASLKRHQQFPYVYEEQTMVLIDPLGHREMRRLRRYTRIEADRTVKFLLVFDAPQEIRGVALLARRRPDGGVHHGVYLPAFGPELKRPQDADIGAHFLGTDFSIEDLTPQSLEDFNYARQRDRVSEGIEYFVVDAYPKNERPGSSASGLRRHVVRKDNLMIVQTDVYDTTLRFFKRITRHDLKRVDEQSWRANMIIAHDRRESHRTLLKIDRRIYSRDYVPAELFEPAYLLANKHVQNPALGDAGTGASDAEQELLEWSDES